MRSETMKLKLDLNVGQYKITMKGINMNKCINCEKDIKYPYMIIVNHNNDEEYKSCFDCGNNKQYEIGRKIKEKKDDK